MIDLTDCLIIIPARGGSKGIPNKNIVDLNGKPLIYYTLDISKQIASAENICVSTDSKKVADLVEKYGMKIPFMRPAELATDTAGSEDVLKHAINFYKKEKNIVFKTIILLQPTSPFRKADHIKEAFNLYSEDIDMVVSVNKTKSNPYYSLFEENNKGFLEKSKTGNFTRRQDIPDVWELNGSIYVINVESLFEKGMQNFDKIVKYPMNKYYSLDIDTLVDFEFCEYLLKYEKIKP